MIDVSNYTGPLPLERVRRWQQAGVVRVIIQGVDPPPGYPDGVTRQQLAVCAEAGMPVDGYVYLWFGDIRLQRFKHDLSLFEGAYIDRLWIDVEDISVLQGDPLLLADAYAWAASHNYTCGIYSASWYWNTWMRGADNFGFLPLWAAQYDGKPDPDIFEPFGGWTRCEIKQYQGTSNFEDVDGIDLNWDRGQ